LARASAKRRLRMRRPRELLPDATLTLRLVSVSKKGYSTLRR
jgi:hypothetical protein